MNSEILPVTLEEFLSENRKFFNGVFEAIYFKSRAISEKNVRKVLNSTINPLALEIFEDEDWKIEASEKLSAEKIATLLLAAADISPDTTKTFAQTARKFHCKRKFFSMEHLEVLSNVEFIQDITESNLRDLVFLCATGKVEPMFLELHIEKNIRLLDNDNSKYYQKIRNLDLELDEAVIEFLAHKISFSYLDDYRKMWREYQDEFWNWVNLQYTREDVRNPANLFFQIYYDMNGRGLSMKDLIERRLHIEDGGDIKFHALKNGELVFYEYDYLLEEIKAQYEIDNFKKSAFQSRERTNEHHIFFPEEAYHGSEKLIRFRNQPENRIRILENAHNRLNSQFKNMRHENYRIPIIHEDLVDMIRANRVKYPADFQNFTELLRVLASICQDYISEYSDEELLENEVFQNAQNLFKFLKISSRFITPKTVKP